MKANRNKEEMMDSIGTENIDLPKPAVKRKGGVSPIWLLPLIAALIGVWLVYKGIVEAPIEAVINFHTAEGIIPGKTKVLYKGLNAGDVKKIKMNPDLDSVDVTVEFTKSADPLLRAQTLFWLVTPSVNVTEVTGLETIMTGNYIAMRPGRGEPALRFKALDAPPAIDEHAPGLHLQLVADELPSVHHGSPIYYKKHQIGDVQSYRLMDDKERFIIKIHIRPEYEELITKGSRFWNASGIQIEGSLSSFQLRTESFVSMLKGGIAFFTPEHARESPAAVDKDEFKLYSNFQTAQAGIPITIRFPDGQGLNTGQTKVKFKGINIGFVDRIRILPDLSGVTARVMINPRAEQVLRKGTKFWMVTPKVSITEVSGLETLTGGAYIDILPGKGATQSEFVALAQSPRKLKEPKHLNITLLAERRGSLKGGSPVYYRQVKVGEVTGYELSKTADEVHIFASIQERYAPLVRENSRFWNVSGIDFSLFGGLKTESIESVLAGGISFATPNNDTMGQPVKNKAVFELHDKHQNAWLDWKPTIELK